MVLIKIESIHNNVRTDEMEGYCLDLPQLGKSFRIISLGGGLSVPSSDRMISTTSVNKMELIDDYTVEFRTKNSTYRLLQYASDKPNKL